MSVLNIGVYVNGNFNFSAASKDAPKVEKSQEECLQGLSHYQKNYIRLLIVIDLF